VFVTRLPALGCGRARCCLSPDDIDFLRGRVEVRRQVKLFGGNRQMFALPKGRKTRSVPLPDSVRDDLAAYLTRFPARLVSLPWERFTATPVEVPLLLLTRESKALNRELLQHLRLKEGSDRCGHRADPRERLPRPAALLREHAARRRRVDQGAERVPRPRGSWLHAEDLHALDADQRRAHPTRGRRDAVCTPLCTQRAPRRQSRRSAASSPHYYDI
jgi:hypothetical protein